MAKINPAAKSKVDVAEQPRIGTINTSGIEVHEEPAEYPEYGTVIATDDSPYHKPGEEVVAHAAVKHRMIKRGWAKEV